VSKGTQGEAVTCGSCSPMKRVSAGSTGHGRAGLRSASGPRSPPSSFANTSICTARSPRRMGQIEWSSQSTLLEAVRQRIKKRRGGCRSNLRSSVASDHAFCAGQIDAWRVRGCFATRRLALRRTSARCHFGCRIIGSRMGDLQRRRTMSWWQCAIYTRKSTEHNLDLTSLLSG
jgi:hypothetical protein